MQRKTPPPLTARQTGKRQGESPLDSKLETKGKPCIPYSAAVTGGYTSIAPGWNPLHFKNKKHFPANTQILQAARHQNGKKTKEKPKR